MTENTNAAVDTSKTSTQEVVTQNNVATDEVVDATTPASEALQKATPPEAVEEYPTHEDPSIKGILTLLKESKLSAKDADQLFLKAAKDGKLESLDIKALTDKVGAEKANLIMLGIKDYHTRVFVARQEKIDAVYSTLGGEDNWIKVRDWAREVAKADPKMASLVKEANQAFDLNPTTARAAAKELMDMYNKDPKNSSLTTSVVTGDSSASASGTDRIGRKDYLAKLKEAEKANDWAEVGRLNSLRMASIKAGYDVNKTGF